MNAQREDASGARGAIAAIGGGLAGLLVFGPMGYLLGLAFLDWFGPESCCGLEGLLSPVIGLGMGAAAGLISGGAVAWRASERQGTFRPGLLVLLLAAGLALAWAIGKTVFSYDYEDGGSLLLFFSIGLALPLLGWGFWPRSATRGPPTDV